MSTLLRDRGAGRKYPARKRSVATLHGKPGKSGLTLVEVAVVTVIVIGLFIAVLLPLHRKRVQAERNDYALNFPGRVYRFTCRPAKDSFHEGELITLDCSVIDYMIFPVDYIWGYQLFMLSTDEATTETPGYPVPPDAINVPRAGTIVDRNGRERGTPPKGGFTRLNPWERIKFTVTVGPAEGKGFKGKAMLDQGIGGFPGDRYDLRDPEQKQLIDDRFLLSNEFQYEVTQGPEVHDATQLSARSS